MGTAPGSSLVGKRLHRYRILEPIGEGGMANVYLARADGPGGFRKWVAIKVMHPDLATQPQMASMLLDEARLAARITHPNVVTVIDVGRDGDLGWIAMEYLKGECLRDVLVAGAEDPEKQLPVALAAHIACEAAEGLHAAHELVDDDGKPVHLVHRDVSPDNIFLTDDGVVKVTDFGIAKAADRLSHTRAGMLKGKIAYMSPERALDMPFDRRTDIFALGAVLWEALTLRRLFRAATHEEVVKRLVDEAVEPPSRHRKACPPELDAIVLKALSKEPHDRYQTAHDFARALKRFLLETAPELDRNQLAGFLAKHFAAGIDARQKLLRAAASIPPEAAAATAEIQLTPPQLANAPTSLQGRATPGDSGASLEKTPHSLGVPLELAPTGVPSPRIIEVGGPSSTPSKPVQRISQTDINSTAPQRPASRAPRRDRGGAWLWLAAGALAVATVGILVTPVTRRAAAPDAPAPAGQDASLTVVCEPACSRVVVDDREAPLVGPIRVSAGRHIVDCTKGTARRRLSVVLSPGQESRLRVVFE